jgi:hypothetical protein
MDKPLHIVVWQDSNVDGYSSNVTVLTERIAKLEAAIERLTLSSSPSALASEEKKTPLISGIDMKRMPESTGTLSAVHPPDVRNILYNLITQPPMASINKYINEETPLSEVDVAPFELDAEDDADAPVEDDADAPVEDDADAPVEDDADAPVEDEADDEGSVEDDVAEEEDVGESEQLEEFEYKGTTYWKDSQNQVYITDETGDLVDQPYGVWSDEKKKVLKYPK